MISQILSFLFPPKLPGQIRDWEEEVERSFQEQGSAGPARPKKYRNGIERYFAENTHPIHRIDLRQAHIQSIRAQKEIDIFERALLAEGYINTIHDCWELPSKEA